MVAIVPNEAEVNMLEAILNKTPSSDVVLHLFTNDYTPIETTVVADLTEMVGAGYAAITLAGASWTITPGNPASASFAQQTFLFTGSFGLVYGVYVTNTTGDLLWAERFSTAVDIQTNGDEIKVTPTLSLKEFGE